MEQRKTEFIVEKRRDAASSAEEAEWDYKRPPRRKRTRDERDDGNMDEEDLVLMGMWETDAAFESGPTRNPVATGPYSFVPPSASKDPLRDVGKLSDNDSLDTTEQDIEAAERLTGTAYEVLESGYTGDGMIGGQHGAQLVITPGECVQHQPVFRWIHFSHKSMDFDNFAVRHTIHIFLLLSLANVGLLPFHLDPDNTLAWPDQKRTARCRRSNRTGQASKHQANTNLERLLRATYGAKVPSNACSF